MDIQVDHSSWKLEEACQYRIDLDGCREDQKAPDHTTFARFPHGLLGSVEDLFYQFVKKLEDMGEADHQTVHRRNKAGKRCWPVHLVWRKPIQKHS